ncbi:heat-inducible transcriptional repressor HrcA [Candidatus Synechococcus calcipolaris G9]|uniref:Heat-inducible transcription repressor HrcA n=1 Tax=Candidatus Synechococcus calcipolaris G9 TaxID=1497997 RepID=A0ABT6F1F1_9SYNE|nr:heat-inducible transcriptional repressor HrcA [Candidatus Synechococcus calcipolaris]MDG2991683.1 heat-inducible transcriptional repressor HrcA [Candidatus Synechococcus calcipolaris G9]
MEIHLNKRQKHVLWATINHYIATAEPVGSKVLAGEYNLNVSSATIRNIMAVLEKGGLLYQPHTSAGRIPSDSGYRIYVDHLVQPAPDVAQQVEHLLNRHLEWGRYRLETILRQAAQLLSDLSGCITLITLPATLGRQIRFIKLVAIAPTRIMVIVVTDNYETQSAVFDLPLEQLQNTDAADAAEPDEAMLDRILNVLSNFLNHHLQGRSLADLSTLDWQDMDREFQQFARLLQNLLVELSEPSPFSDSGSLVMSGLSEVLQQPEFSHLQQVQMLIHLLEDQQDQLYPLIYHSPDAPITIRIGAENPLEPMRACTLVYSSYKRGDTPVGSIGILGPTRMPYGRIIPIVEAAAEYLSGSLTNTNGINGI